MMWMRLGMILRRDRYRHGHRHRDHRVGRIWHRNGSGRDRPIRAVKGSRSDVCRLFCSTGTFVGGTGGLCPRRPRAGCTQGTRVGTRGLSVWRR